MSGKLTVISVIIMMAACAVVCTLPSSDGEVQEPVLQEGDAWGYSISVSDVVTDEEDKTSFSFKLDSTTVIQITEYKEDRIVVDTDVLLKYESEEKKTESNIENIDSYVKIHATVVMNGDWGIQSISLKGEIDMESISKEKDQADDILSIKADMKGTVEFKDALQIVKFPLEEGKWESTFSTVLKDMEFNLDIKDSDAKPEDLNFSKPIPGTDMVIKMVDGKMNIKKDLIELGSITLNFESKWNEKGYYDISVDLNSLLPMSKSLDEGIGFGKMDIIGFPFLTYTNQQLINAAGMLGVETKGLEKLTTEQKGEYLEKIDASKNIEWDLQKIILIAAIILMVIVAIAAVVYISGKRKSTDDDDDDDEDY